MSLHRFFLTGAIADGVLPLSEADRRHAHDVLRLRAGEEVVAVEPGGSARVVRLAGTGPQFTGEIVGELAAEAGPRVWLVQALAKRDRTDLAVRMAVELGAAGVAPVISGRTVVKLDAGKVGARGDRLRRIALEAAKQSQRSYVPTVTDPVPLADVGGVLPQGCVLLVPWEEASGRGVREAVRASGAAPATPVAVVVGPEGGLEPAEVSLLESRGAEVFSLGPTILRTDTAAVVALSLVIHELGGLGGGNG